MESKFISIFNNIEEKNNCILGEGEKLVQGGVGRGKVIKLFFGSVSSSKTIILLICYILNAFKLGQSSR